MLVGIYKYSGWYPAQRIHLFSFSVQNQPKLYLLTYLLVSVFEIDNGQILGAKYFQFVKKVLTISKHFLGKTMKICKD